MDDEELQRTLQQWSAEARADEARRQRSSSEAHRRLAGEEAKFSGLLLDLAERHAIVAMTVVGDRRHMGTITEVGIDFAAISSPDRQTIYVRDDAIVSIETQAIPGRLRPPSARTVVNLRSFADVATELAAKRDIVRFVSTGSSTVRSGRITTVGTDIATVEVDGPPSRSLFLALTQLNEIGLA